MKLTEWFLNLPMIYSLYELEAMEKEKEALEEHKQPLGRFNLSIFKKLK